MRKICIHIIDINNYFQELKKLTLLTIERFCERISADLNIITERKFPNWPILTEKLQVYKDGFNYEYNILLDLDILIHPDCYNPFGANIPITHCAFKDNYNASDQLDVDDIYFKRDGRNVGISGCAIFTTKYTHDLWKFPKDLTKKDVINNILQDRKIVDEYIVSRNLAKYGLKYIEPYPMKKEYNLMFHLGIFGHDKQKILDRAELWFKTFWN